MLEPLQALKRKLLLLYKGKLQLSRGLLNDAAGCHARWHTWAACSTLMETGSTYPVHDIGVPDQHSVWCNPAASGYGGHAIPENYLLSLPHEPFLCNLWLGGRSLSAVWLHILKIASMFGCLASSGKSRPAG